MDRIFGRRTTHAKNLRQAYVLLILGVITLLAAWLLHPNLANYPIGPLVLGIGFIMASYIQSLSFSCRQLVSALPPGPLCLFRVQ